MCVPVFCTWQQQLVQHKKYLDIIRLVEVLHWLSYTWKYILIMWLEVEQEGTVVSYSVTISPTLSHFTFTFDFCKQLFLVNNDSQNAWHICRNMCLGNVYDVSVLVHAALEKIEIISVFSFFITFVTDHFFH